MTDISDGDYIPRPAMTKWPGEFDTYPMQAAIENLRKYLGKSFEYAQSKKLEEPGHGMKVPHVRFFKYHPHPDPEWNEIEQAESERRGCKVRLDMSNDHSWFNDGHYRYTYYGDCIQILLTPVQDGDTELVNDHGMRFDPPRYLKANGDII